MQVQGFHASFGHDAVLISAVHGPEMTRVTFNALELDTRKDENLREVRALDAAVRDAVGSRPACIRQELRPEHAVEDRKVDRKVLVDRLGLGSVVEMVVAGRHQEGLQPPQLRAEVGVDEDRVKGDEAR